MKKRILSILLLCCMVLTLLPTAAFAADTGKAIQLGTDALSKNVNTASAPTVYFGKDHENNPAAWRVIGYNGNGVASAQGDMTLLAAGNMSSVLQFADFGTNNRYASSYLKTAIDALAEKLTTEENTAVKKRTLTSGSYNGENTDCVAGEQVDNAVFWPLSTAEAFAVNQDLRIVDKEHTDWAISYWWLRSPGSFDFYVAFVRGNGEVYYSGFDFTTEQYGVRPAFNLNLNAVLFTSAAVGGKPGGGLTPISEYTDNKWKLTLLDNSRNFDVTEKTANGYPGDTVKLNYSGATTGTNEYISVIIADNSGAQYYGRVAQPTEATGTVDIKIPSDLVAGNYTLKVFNEQCNGDYETDYASKFTDISLTVEKVDEQFSLAPGGTYYFDLSSASIPGTVNDALPDKTMHYVPFTYTGTVHAYNLTSAMATTEEDAEQNEYDHSLFVADYAVTHTVSWDDLNNAGLIFGKDYAAGGVDYALRAPSVGSGSTGSVESQRGTPQSNEWDRILDKDDGYIKNWKYMFSWGQDTYSAFSSGSGRALRGYFSARLWFSSYATDSSPSDGFRPVLEVLNPGTLGSNGLKAVTLDLGGGKLGVSTDTIQIIVKTGESFTAPASEGLTRPDGNTGNYFKWRGSDGELYAPDDNVPADVTKLTAQFDEQFTLAPGGTYYFDLSGVGIPDTVNDALPDNTLHYVPFTYAGTVDAYKLTSEMATTEEYAETYKYAHSLFVADYAVTYAASWDHLNAIDMIFGKDYAAGGVDYTLRAPSEGSDYTGSGDSERGTPQSNEWDRLLDKDDGYIKNWNGIFSCGQDTVIRLPWRRTVRGHYSSRFCGHRDAAGQNPQVGFRPVLEVLNRDTIGPDGLKTVTLDLGGGKLGDESSIRIIVKNGSEFTAPASDGLTRPEGATGNYFKWLGSDGKLYAPGASVPADVTTLTARFVPDTYTVIVTTDSLPDGKTGKAYSHTLTAIGAAPITWSIDSGALPAGLNLNRETGEISGIPTTAGTATFTVKAENSEGSDTRALSIIISNPVEQTPVRYLDADGKERFCTEYTVLESVIIEDFFDSDNKWYDMPAGWYVVEGDVTITPRLDTHGAVNLILKDDCHLTVPWGINVKEGDTFTIYAQSTAEASMGKLTACLPELSDHEKSVWPVAGLSGIGAGVRVWAANDNYYENEGTIIINGGNIHAKGQQASSAIGGSDYEHNTSYDGDTPGNLRQGGSITINGGIVCTELRTSGGAHLSDSFGIGTCGGNGGSVTINGGTIIAEASSSAISSGRGGSITINGGNVTAHGGINRYENQPLYAIPGNGIGSLEGGSITINGGTVKASSEGDGFGIGGAGVHHTAEMHITINGGNIETTANRNNAAIGDKSKHKSSVTINGGVIHAVGKGSAAGIGSTGDIRITGGELAVFAEGGGAAIGSIGGVDCKSITINGNVIKSISSKDGACIGGTTGGSVGSITISDAALPSLSAEKILIGWDADSPGGKLTIRNCRVESTDIPTTRTDGIRVGSNSELVIEESEIRLPHFRSIRVGGNGSIAVRDSDLHTYGIFMDETVQSPNDAKTLKKLEITDSTVLTGDIIGARGGYSSVEEVVIHDSSIRLNDEYTYNYCTIGGGTNGSFGSIDIQNSQIHIPSSGGNTAIGNGWQVYYNRESRIRIANSEVSVRCASLGPAIGAAWDSGSGRINIIIENSTVTAKGGNLRTDGNYVPGIGKNALGRAPEIGIQILNSTVDSFRLTEREGTDYVYDDLHTKELPGIPAENISICGSTVNGTRIDHSFDEYGKCTLCGKYDLGYCYEHGLLTLEGLTDCVSDGSEKKLTGLSHQTGENETKQLAENMDYTAIYSNNVNPYTLTPDDAGFDPEKAPKVTLYGTGNYCGKAEHYFTISESTAAAPTITTDTLPNGKVGEAYSHTLTADGTTPITWSVSGSALPEGLTLNETTGEISGTPTAEGTAKFTVKAENSAGSDTKELSITITKDAPPSHEHSYGNWRKDGTSHWHECTDTDCPNREESITDKASHVYTDDTDTTCDVCGYERTVTPPSHEHSYGNWRKDGTSHWHECTDTDCPNREESITDKASHVYTDDTDTTCDVCGYERTVTPPSHEHSYGNWRKDGTSHWHECTDTDCPNREESITDKASHVYTDDTDTTCDVCGYERTVTPPAHEHSYGDWSKDGTSHWHECTDTDCPNREESITDKASHVYTDDTDTTCDVCGYERTVAPPAPTEFIVTFDGNGGTPSVGSMTTTDQKLTSLPSASRSGSYSFDGWYTKKSGGTKVTTDTVFSANTTVYAHWTYTGGGGGGYNPPVTYYTLRFETGGGSDIPSVRETYNAYIDLTQYVPTWRGHTFIGWYSERGLINKVSGVYLTKDMTVYAGWRVDENPGTGANPFTDVSEKDWFYGDVMFVYENGLMLGTSKTLFSPHGTATRGMMATILWRMGGSPVPKGKNSFTDVEAGKWYADAITWTAENRIFAGYGKDKFGPDDPITREQLAAIFYRYADYKGYDLTVKGNLDKFKDADKITDYAKTAMQWAVGSGLVKGKSGNLLDPQGTATRAEIAAMLHRFIEKYELVQGKAPSGLMGWIDPKRLKSQRPATAAR